ncbi:hypothetical protein N7474_007786 [Penicillium riverlandense]|uniref:uncharacterized protein n=1 Tax=Penicillium riverlandense TaxID=1903569 RepID=UPI002548F478|nr:uncharacterized protein N7474_007786 [Penicillium riverlandense]KAJ5811485.1 hypothetical protein N7474_007786 [Penicillium riverlandense]
MSGDTLEEFELKGFPPEGLQPGEETSPWTAGLEERAPFPAERLPSVVRTDMEIASPSVEVEEGHEKDSKEKSSQEGSQESQPVESSLAFIGHQMRTKDAEGRFVEEQSDEEMFDSSYIDDVEEYVEHIACTGEGEMPEASYIEYVEKIVQHVACTGEDEQAKPETRISASVSDTKSVRSSSSDKEIARHDCTDEETTSPSHRHGSGHKHTDGGDNGPSELRDLSAVLIDHPIATEYRARSTSQGQRTPSERSPTSRFHSSFAGREPWAHSSHDSIARPAMRREDRQGELRRDFRYPERATPPRRHTDTIVQHIVPNRPLSASTAQQCQDIVRSIPDPGPSRYPAGISSQHLPRQRPLPQNVPSRRGHPTHPNAPRRPAPMAPGRSRERYRVRPFPPRRLVVIPEQGPGHRPEPMPMQQQRRPSTLTEQQQRELRQGTAAQRAAAAGATDRPEPVSMPTVPVNRAPPRQGPKRVSFGPEVMDLPSTMEDEDRQLFSPAPWAEPLRDGFSERRLGVASNHPIASCEPGSGAGPSAQKKPLKGILKTPSGKVNISSTAPTPTQSGDITSPNPQIESPRRGIFEPQPVHHPLVASSDPRGNVSATPPRDSIFKPEPRPIARPLTLPDNAVVLADWAPRRHLPRHNVFAVKPEPVARPQIVINQPRDIVRPTPAQGVSQESRATSLPTIRPREETITIAAIVEVPFPGHDELANPTPELDDVNSGEIITLSFRDTEPPVPEEPSRSTTLRPEEFAHVKSVSTPPRLISTPSSPDSGSSGSTTPRQSDYTREDAASTTSRPIELSIQQPTPAFAGARSARASIISQSSTIIDLPPSAQGPLRDQPTSRLSTVTVPLILVSPPTPVPAQGGPQYSSHEQIPLTDFRPVIHPVRPGDAGNVPVAPPQDRPKLILNTTNLDNIQEDNEDSEGSESSSDSGGGKDEDDENLANKPGEDDGADAEDFEKAKDLGIKLREGLNDSPVNEAERRSKKRRPLNTNYIDERLSSIITGEKSQRDWVPPFPLCYKPRTPPPREDEEEAGPLPPAVLRDLRYRYRAGVMCQHETVLRFWPTSLRQVCDECGEQTRHMWVCTADTEDWSVYDRTARPERSIEQLAPWLIKAIEEGHYTDEQVERFIEERYEVQLAALRDRNREHTPPDTRSSDESGDDSDEATEWWEETMTIAEMVETRNKRRFQRLAQRRAAIEADVQRTLPCMEMWCQKCHPGVEERALGHIDEIVMQPYRAPPDIPEYLNRPISTVRAILGPQWREAGVLNRWWQDLVASSPVDLEPVLNLAHLRNLNMAQFATLARWIRNGMPTEDRLQRVIWWLWDAGCADEYFFQSLTNTRLILPRTLELGDWDTGDRQQQRVLFTIYEEMEDDAGQLIERPYSEYWIEDDEEFLLSGFHEYMAQQVVHMRAHRSGQHYRPSIMGRAGPRSPSPAWSPVGSLARPGLDDIEGQVLRHGTDRHTDHDSSQV